MFVIYEHFIKLTSKHLRGVSSDSFLTFIRQFYHQSSIFPGFYVQLQGNLLGSAPSITGFFSLPELNCNLIFTKWQLKCLANEIDWAETEKNYLGEKRINYPGKSKYFGVSGRLTRNDLNFRNLFLIFLSMKITSSSSIFLAKRNRNV